MIRTPLRINNSAGRRKLRLHIHRWQQLEDVREGQGGASLGHPHCDISCSNWISQCDDLD